MREDHIEAANRAECVAECRKRGISPTMIAEGGKGRDKRGPSRSAARVDACPPRQRRLTGRAAILAAVVLAAVAGGVWWWAVRPEPVPQKEKPAKPKIEKPKAEKPVKLVEKPAPKVEQKVEPPATNAVPPKEVLEPGTRRHVEWKRPDNWDQLTRAQKTRIQPVGRVIKPVGWGGRQLFTQQSDKRIERLMRIQPGRLILGTLRYDEHFVKDFLESLKTPIEYSDEDTDADKAIKDAVKAARDDLKAAYDRGEDIADIMTQTEKQMHELAAYKMNLSKMVIDYRRSGEHSDQDVKDFINAANVMLKDNGMEPLRFGELWFRKAQLDAKELRNEKEAEK